MEYNPAFLSRISSWIVNGHRIEARLHEHKDIIHYTTGGMFFQRKISF